MSARHKIIGLMLWLLLLPLFRVEAQSMAGYTPGNVVPEQVLNDIGPDSFFMSQEIPDTIFALMQGRSYKPDCTIPRTDLRYLLILHRNLEGQAVVGELVVNKEISAVVLEIMLQLFKESYPIEQMRLIDYYDADDEKSMMANNSSCFNWRTISGSAKVSKHAMGMAIDINPLYNPYYKSSGGKELVQPAGGKPYLDRNADFPYKIVKNDACYRLFTAYGFKWGGAWNSSKDYQHFER